MEEEPQDADQGSSQSSSVAVLAPRLARETCQEAIPGAFGLLQSPCWELRPADVGNPPHWSAWEAKPMPEHASMIGQGVGMCGWIQRKRDLSPTTRCVVEVGAKIPP